MLNRKMHKRENGLVLCLRSKEYFLRMQQHTTCYSPQLDDTKRLADAEARDRATLMSKFKNLSSELDTMRERIEEESEQKAEILKQLSKAQAEIQLWRSKYETEGLGR